MNKVIETKKAADANLIMRREETAAMRSQANTAKLLENNPILMRLRELHAGPIDFLAKAFLPIVRRMGPNVRAVLEKPGFYPAGGGRFKVFVEPTNTLSRIDLLERGKIIRQTAFASVSNLPLSIAHRELKVISEKMQWVGKAYVFYPEATQKKCTAALLLDIDLILLHTEKVVLYSLRSRCAEENTCGLYMDRNILQKNIWRG